MRSSFKWSAVLASATLVFGSVIACSSSDDASSEPSPEVKFCNALTSANSKCGGSSCGTAVNTDCTKLAGLVSPTILAAAAKCMEATACGTEPRSCLGTALGSATQTAAQTSLATSYCDSCSVKGGDHVPREDHLRDLREVPARRHRGGREVERRRGRGRQLRTDMARHPAMTYDLLLERYDRELPALRARGEHLRDELTAWLAAATHSADTTRRLTDVDS